MTYDPDRLLARFGEIRRMLDGVPRELWHILLPPTAAGLPLMQENIIRFKKRQQERGEVMAIQQLCGLPLRPNEALGETRAKARLMGRIKDRLHNRFKKNKPGDSDDSNEISDGERDW